MTFNWTFGRKLAVGFSIAGATLALVALLGYQNIHRLIETDRWVNHTFEVRSEIASLLGFMVDAETGERGFLLTGKDDTLEPYVLAIGHVEKSFEHLKKQTADNPRQQDRLAALRPQAFELAKGHIRGQVLEKFRRDGTAHDAAVTALWLAPDTAASIRDYVARTFKKSV